MELLHGLLRQLSKITSTSTVGVPRESNISLAYTSKIVLILHSPFIFELMISLSSLSALPSLPFRAKSGQHLPSFLLPRLLFHIFRYQDQRYRIGRMSGPRITIFIGHLFRIAVIRSN